MTQDERMEMRRRIERGRDRTDYYDGDMLRLLDAVDQAEAAKDAAYTERNQLVALLAALFPSSLERHPDADTEWGDAWRDIVLIDLPTGQVSWHIHDSELSLFAHVPRKGGRVWDGHTTEEQYQRVHTLIHAFRKIKEAEAIPREFFYATDDASRDLLERLFVDTIQRAVPESLLHHRGVLSWEWQAIFPEWMRTNIYTLNLRVMTAENGVLPDPSRGAEAE